MCAAQLARTLELRQVRPSRNRRDAPAVADIGNLQRASVVHLFDNHRARSSPNSQRFLRARLPHGQPPMPRCGAAHDRRQRSVRDSLAMYAASASAGSAHRLVLRCQHLCLIMARERHGTGFAKARADERTLCGRLLDTPCIVGRDPGAQEKSRARFIAANCRAKVVRCERFRAGTGTSGSLRVSKCRPTTSLLSKSRPKTKRYPKVARQHHDVQISPKNTAASAREDTRPTSSPCAAMAIPMQPGTPFHASPAQHARLKPAEPTTRRSAKNLLASRCRRQLRVHRFRCDTRQIFVRILRHFPASVSSHQ